MRTWRSWAGIAAAILLLAVEAPVMVRAVQIQKTRTTRLLPPFHVKAFEPVVRTADPIGVSLYQTDRILELDGRVVRNRGDIEDGLRAAEPRGIVRLKVRHYPEDGEEWEEEALGMFAPQDRFDKGFYAELWSTAWFGMVVWPCVCLLLAAAVLASNGESGRAWLVGLTLAGMGHLHWMLVTPYAWDDPWRTLFVLYDAAVASSIPFFLAAVGYSLPRAIQLVGAGWVFLNVAVRLAERTSYSLLSPFAWMDSWIGTGTYLLIMVAGVALSIRWIRGKEKALRWGSWAFLGGLGFLFIFLPRVMGDY